MSNKGFFWFFCYFSGICGLVCVNKFDGYSLLIG